MSATCGCCSGIHAETPRLVANRPGLSMISYRAGDFGAFKRSMLAELRRTNVSTREDDDFSVALVDAWAMTADVLTFYEERIANESYLRTAGERSSVLELARLIGYELKPGVSAEVSLAFTVDDAVGAPGHVTIDAGSRVQSVPGQNEQPQTFETSATLGARAEWNELKARLTKIRNPSTNDVDTYFAGTEANIRVGDGLLFFDASLVAKDFRRVATVTPDFDNSRTRVTWVGILTANFDHVYPMRVQAPLFGYNAPDPRVMSKDNVAPALITASPLPNATADWVFDIKAAALTIRLDGAHPAILPGSDIVITTPVPVIKFDKVTSVAEVAAADYGMSGKATKVVVGKDPSGFGGDVYRTTLVFAAPEKIGPAEQPDTDVTSTAFIDLDRAITKLEKGHSVIVRGKSADTGNIETELAVVADSVTSDGHTKVSFKPSLQHSYDRTTVSIFGNIVAATHGESVRELLGSGDASVPFQRFVLSHVPLTYVHAPSEPNGAGTTLSIFVNDILWREVPTLYGAGRYDRVYITRRDDDGKTTVQFGDGVAGSRLPSGSSNVRAIYRKGVGLDGNVDAGKITLLMSRPLGLSEVTNLTPAAGGDVPQVIGDARKNAPRTVLTLDRAVSILDYQTFAASFAGIAKAIATTTLTHTEQQVFLTVAGPKGATFANNDPTLRALRTSLVSHGKPYLPIRVLPYQKVTFRLVAFIGIAGDHAPELVLPLVRTAVETAFSFEAREFGEAVDLSDIVRVIHAVDGVISVDVDALHRETDLSPSRQERLAAHMPEQLASGTLVPAEILTLGAHQIDKVAP
jgi:hypothetical protein